MHSLELINLIEGAESELDRLNQQRSILDSARDRTAQKLERLRRFHLEVIAHEHLRCEAEYFNLPTLIEFVN